MLHYRAPNNWRQTNGDNYREVPPMSEDTTNLRNEGFASGPSGNLHLQHGPDAPKVHISELYVAFMVFSGECRQATRHVSVDSLSEYQAEMDAATAKFRVFCEEHGLADRIDWEERP